MKLFTISLIILILVVQAFAEASLLSNAAKSPIPEESEAIAFHKKHHHHHHHHKNINCSHACSRRCKKSSRKNVCHRACKTCCKRCNCVPPGTYGNKAACPCYAALKTHGNKPKCP